MIGLENGQIVRHSCSFPPIPFNAARKLLETNHLNVIQALNSTNLPSGVKVYLYEYKLPLIYFGGQSSSNSL
jgi:hypothetical protein